MSKIVRDKIPHYIKLKGEIPDYTVLSSSDLNGRKRLLTEKLTEEVKEFQEDPSIEELADIVEVCFGLAAAMDYQPEELETVRLGKFAARGGFYRGMILR